MVRQTPLFHVYVNVQFAPSSALGAWFRALVLRLQVIMCYYTTGP